MTVADKLRELFATRPAVPTLTELTRWWRASAELVPSLLEDLEGIDADLVAARAALRREQDVRAELRLEINEAKMLARDAQLQAMDRGASYQQVVAERDECAQVLRDILATCGEVDASTLPDEPSVAVRKVADKLIEARAELERERARHEAEIDDWVQARDVREQTERELRATIDGMRPDAEAWRKHVEVSTRIPPWFEGAMLAAAVEDAKRAAERKPVDLDALRARAHELAPSEIREVLDEVQLYRNLTRKLMALAKYEQRGAEPHPASFLDCPDCRALSKSGANPPRCERFLAMEANHG